MSHILEIKIEHLRYSEYFKINNIECKIINTIKSLIKQQNGKFR
jgi:hypothetical protein